MPAPARTSYEAIVEAARTILEEDGLDAITMASVGDRVGVRGPSLYKHVRDRSALVKAVAEAVVADLARTISGATTTGDPRADLRAIAHAYRAFVQAQPNGYALLFGGLPADARPDPSTLADVARPLVASFAALVGEERALPAARTFVAWAHGFVSMELAGAFRLGGDLDEAYSAGIETIIGAA